MRVDAQESISLPTAQANRPLPAIPKAQKPQEQCVICLEEIHERAIAVPCNHSSFDFACLASWAHANDNDSSGFGRSGRDSASVETTSATCPLCKAPLEAIEYDWRSPTDFQVYKVVRNQTVTHAPSVRALNRVHRQRLPGPACPRYTQSVRVQRPDATLLRRRLIYTHNLRSQHIGTNRVSRFRNFTALTFSKSPDLERRAKTWIRRELEALLPFSSSDAPHHPHPALTRSSLSQSTPKTHSFLLSYILALLSTLELKSADDLAEQKLAEFLGEKDARIFLHELESWLRSPFERVEAWDAWVQYGVDLDALVEQDPEARSLSRSSGKRRARDHLDTNHQWHADRTAGGRRTRDEEWDLRRFHAPD